MLNLMPGGRVLHHLFWQCGIDCDPLQDWIYWLILLNALALDLMMFQILWNIQIVHDCLEEAFASLLWHQQGGYYLKISTYTSWSSFLTHILYSWFILLAQEISSGHLPKYSTLLCPAFQLGRLTVAKIRVKSIYLSPRHLLSSLLPGGSLTSLVEVVIKLLAQYQFWSQGAW